MKTCDLCGQKVEKLSELEKDFQTDEIKELCEPCMNEANAIVQAVWSKSIGFLARAKRRGVLAWFREKIRVS